MTDGPWLDDDQQRVWRQWLAVSSRLPVALHRELQSSSGLSLQDFDVLVALTESPGGRLRITDLAQQLAWERSRLSHHVARMASRGLVAREEYAEDRRGALVAVTPAGRAAIGRAAPSHAATVRRLVFDGLGEDELSTLGRVLERVAERLSR